MHVVVRGQQASGYYSRMRLCWMSLLIALQRRCATALISSTLQHLGSSMGFRHDFFSVAVSLAPVVQKSTRRYAAGRQDVLTLSASLLDARRCADEALELYRKNRAGASSLPLLNHQITDFEREQSSADFWDESNAKRASQVNKLLGKQTRLRDRLKRWSDWEGDIVAALEMLQLGGHDRSSSQGSSISEVTEEEATMLVDELLQTSQLLLDDSRQFELELLLSGPFDSSPARLLLTAGAGGTEANDWVADLFRMYQRHCQDMGFTVQVEDMQSGDVVGYKSVELIVTGENAFGWLHGEKGAHRLVRLSPFNANNKRQTTFAGVDVAPLLDETVREIDLPDADLEVTTMRSGGKGGQNVNKVNSAVRIRHLPSGLQVKCTQERSQILNKEIALQRLKSQLLAIAQEQRVQEIAQIRGDQVEASWGAQIRNYVLHPYKLVKDQRSGWETTNVQGFLDGDLVKDCIGAYLRHKAACTSETESGFIED